MPRPSPTTTGRRSGRRPPPRAAPSFLRTPFRHCAGRWPRVASRLRDAPAPSPPTRSSTSSPRTNHLLPGLATTMLAGCAHLRVDLAGRPDRVVGAGHPPPLLCTPDGRAAALDVANGAVLDAVQQAPRTGPRYCTRPPRC
ncbi:SpoIIE family protein phosphatase [Kitasatospora sp. NPDC057223]|uniref:SpoIIE family protein phosphatase n=1 Tax=Kitasatospora sp. NPDC057223 TaxID=3346055 RepID=UPI003627ACF1